ncbi:MULTISPECIES: hypothetical protein [Stenotrophomonas]|uniref:hypothetical protein n=1 Tax=Stenotrophomonas TaxID=40323 RepID=UPI000871FDB8|nr:MULTISPECIES: hypothetical protein [Stenotrophomonas]OEZ02278.1 hypothetical protein BIY45_01755 [Stenotrophomonas sp. BIIR7]
MSGLVLVPPATDAGVPVRMRQPTKDAYRQWLAQAHDLVERLQADRAGQILPADQHQTLIDLIEAATALGHHETLRTSSDETIDYWRARVDTLRAALIGEHHG